MPLNADRYPPCRSAWWQLVSLLLASLLLGSCATGPTHFGTPPRGDLRFDTETVARARYAGMLSTTGTSAAQVTLASTLVRLAPALLLVLHSDNKVNELQERLQECAR